MANWSYRDAAHLLRRAGFGGSPDVINALLVLGRDSAVDYLVDYTSVDNSEMERTLISGFPPNFPQTLVQLQTWWITRMIITRRPLEEKMTLFWHNHFATAYPKVESALLFIQNQTLRRFGMEHFDDLLLAICRDPAMLVWLDGQSNVLGNPNENFAREIQELFTMGIRDLFTGQLNYTESDVKEIARAFTGWKFKLKRGDINKPKFLVRSEEHDNGAKEVYGRTANFGGEDIVDIICSRAQTPRFLVKKLFDFFVYPLTSSDEDKTTVQKFADVYTQKKHSIRELMRAIFRSEEFASERARLALIKNPAEFIVGAIRSLGASYIPLMAFQPFIHDQFRLVGLDLFRPPDVSGWALNTGWLSTSNLLERYRFANSLASNRLGLGYGAGAGFSRDQIRQFTRSTASQTVESLLSMLGLLDPDPEIVRLLVKYLESDDQGNPVPFSDESIDKTVRGLIHLIMCLPEFQMN